MAAKKPTYWELLQHPNWQRKRLEVLERAHFLCEACASGEKMLHVHHSYYEKGFAPWEYPLASLHALCEECHKSAQDKMALLHRQIGKLSLDDSEMLYGYALGLEAKNDLSAVLDVYGFEVACGIADCWTISVMELIDSVQDGVIDGHRLTAIKERAK